MRIKLSKDIRGHKKGEILTPENMNQNRYLLMLLERNGYAERLDDQEDIKRGEENE